MKLEESEPVKQYFGVRFWHPSWLQTFTANVKFFTFLLFLEGLLQSALIDGFSSIVVSSIERQFRFSSTAMGFLLVTYDITSFFSTIFIGYFGEKHNRPHWIGYGIVVQGIGAFIFSSPQYIFGNDVVSKGNHSLEVCELSSDVPVECDSFNSFNAPAYSIFILGNILIGIGSAPLLTIALSFIDDISLPRLVPVYTGLVLVSITVGPIFGFILGGIFLKIPVDLKHTELNEDDPSWVGAWWICFVLPGILSLIISVPFFLYPRLLPNHQQVEQVRRNQHSTNSTNMNEKEESLLYELKDFPNHIHLLFKNPTFIFVSAGLTALSITVSGFLAFGPTHIQYVFNIPASTAGVLAGGAITPAGIIGILVGSATAYFMTDTKNVAIIPWVCSILTIPAFVGFFLTCPSVDIAGINTPYTNISLSFEDVTISACNQDCMCTSSIYEPVCGSDDVTYFSPCRAGCHKNIDEDYSKVPIFVNCTCIADKMMVSNTSSLSSYSEFLVESNAINGKCTQKCTVLGLWLFLIAVISFLTFAISVPALQITIRCVKEGQRSFALGVQSAMCGALGAIPGPLLFGVILDSSCVYWKEECNQRGNCWVYNNNSIAFRISFLALITVIINTVCMFLSWVFYPPVTCKKIIVALNDDTEKPYQEEKGNRMVDPDFKEIGRKDNETNVY